MRETGKLKYAYLFGGGAIRGTAHVGVLKALEELGVEPTTVAGSSVGSIIASLYAVGYTNDELAQIFLSVNFELFRDISFGFKMKFALSKGEVFLDWIRELIEKKFYGEEYKKGEVKPVTFRDVARNLVIITTKMNEFSCCEFSKHMTPDFEVAKAVRISCCMPGLMRAMRFEDNLLVDGDLMKGKPMWSLSKTLSSLKERILEIRLEGKFSGSDENPIEYVNGMYSCITYSETDFIKSIYGKRDKYDYLVINTGNVVVVDFNYPPEKRQEIIDNGYRQTMEYFKYELLDKKRKLSDVYLTISDRIRNIQGLFLSKRYMPMKNSIAELFIYLVEVKDEIDESIYKSIVKLQTESYKNINSGLLGFVGCSDRESVRNALNKTIEKLDKKNEELKQNLIFLSKTS